MPPVENVRRGNPSLTIHLSFTEYIQQLGKASRKCVLTLPHSIHCLTMVQTHTLQNLAPQMHTIIHKTVPLCTHSQKHRKFLLHRNSENEDQSLRFSLQGLHQDQHRCLGKRGAQSGKTLHTNLTEHHQCKERNVPKTHGCHSVSLNLFQF